MVKVAILVQPLPNMKQVKKWIEIHGKTKAQQMVDSIKTIRGEMYDLISMGAAHANAEITQREEDIVFVEAGRFPVLQKVLTFIQSAMPVTAVKIDTRGKREVWYGQV